MTAKEAIAIAKAIVKRYPEIDNVQDIFEIAKNDGYFKTEAEGMAIWGRLMRLLPATKENINEEQLLDYISKCKLARGWSGVPMTHFIASDFQVINNLVSKGILEIIKVEKPSLSDSNKLTTYSYVRKVVA